MISISVVRSTLNDRFVTHVRLGVATQYSRTNRRSASNGIVTWNTYVKSVRSTCASFLFLQEGVHEQKGTA